MRKLILVAATAAALVVPSAAMAQPTVGPEAGPGCFGQWRAGSVQAVNDTNGGIYGIDVKNAGEIFSDRGADNASLNADARALCAAL